MLADKILKHWNDFEETREWSSPLRASNSGKCTRYLAYQHHGYKPEPLSGRARLVFRLGNLIESDLSEVAQKFGLKDQQKQVSLVIAGQEIKGHIDGILPTDEGDVVVDFKSINARGFNRSAKNEVDDSYIFQMNFYMHALGLKKALIVYYNKDTSALTECVIKYDSLIFKMIQSRFEAVIRSTPESLPEREYSADSKGKLPWQCSYCSMNAHCWPQAQTFFDKNNKPSLVIKNNELSSAVA